MHDDLLGDAVVDCRGDARRNGASSPPTQPVARDCACIRNTVCSIRRRCGTHSRADPRRATGSGRVVPRIVNGAMDDSPGFFPRLDASSSTPSDWWTLDRLGLS